jgi:hypothetical protein
MVKAAVFLRFNHRIALPVSYYLTLLILQLSRLQTAGIQSLSTMQPTLELPTRSPTLPNPSLNDPEALEQTLALQTPVTVLLALKDLSSRRSYARQTEELEWRVLRRALRAQAGQHKGDCSIPITRSDTKNVYTGWRRRG